MPQAKGMRARIESGFEAWGRHVAEHPLPILLASMAVALVCASGLPRVWTDVTFEAFLQDDDPVVVAYDEFRAQFGRDERAILSVEPGPASDARDVFDLGFLGRLRALHEAIEERVPYLDEVTSLVNARDTRGEGDTLLVEDFLDPWPEDPARLPGLRARALANPLFRNNVISADGGITTIVLDIQLYTSALESTEELSGFEPEDASVDAPLPLLSGEETGELVDALHAVINEFQGPDLVIHAAGSPVILQDIASSMFRDMPRFVALAVFSIAALLYLLFRRLAAVVIPLAVVALSVASTIGLMGWFGTPIHVPTQILPSFLLAVGVGDAVHLLTIFYERIRAGDDREEALAHALGHSGLAIVLTSLTTAGGLASFSTSALAPVAAIGVYAPTGVMLALFLSLTLLPALLAIVPVGAPRGASARTQPNRVDRFLRGCGRYAIRHASWVVLLAGIVSVAALVSAAQLRLSHDPLSWLDEEVEIARGTRYIDRALGGSVSFEVLLETDEAGGVRQPEALRALAALGESFERDPRDGFLAAQTVSLADVVKEINRALNEDREEAYAIPDDPRLVSQELLLFENSGTDDLEEIVDSEYRIARMSVRVPWHDAVDYETFFDLADADVRDRLGGLGNASTTGVLAVLVRAINAVVTSLATSYALAFAVITPLMILLLGNLRTGLVAMVPNAMPILWTLGLMGVFDIPLDTFSLLIGGIALGLAVDDTIHFMHNFRRYRSEGADLETAVDRTLQTTGRAMLITTIVLATGFLGFVLSSMNNLANLGILVSFAITVAFAADVLLAPALFALLDRDDGSEGL